jgi:hypothetical protein
LQKQKQIATKKNMKMKFDRKTLRMMKLKKKIKNNVKQNKKKLKE